MKQHGAYSSTVLSPSLIPFAHHPPFFSYWSKAKDDDERRRRSAKKVERESGERDKPWGQKASQITPSRGSGRHGEHAGPQQQYGRWADDGSQAAPAELQHPSLAEKRRDEKRTQPDRHKNWKERLSKKGEKRQRGAFRGAFRACLWKARKAAARDRNVKKCTEG